MLPIALRGDGRRALVVGGGAVALRKTETLLEAGFAVQVVAPRLDVALRSLVERAMVALEERTYESSDLSGVDIVVLATGDDEVNARVASDARTRRILICDATSPERGDFTMLATARVGDLTFAVDSGAGTPAFSKRLIHELRERFGPAYGAAAKTLARMRTYVKATLPPEERAAVMRDLAEMPVDDLARMNPVVAEHAVESAIERQRQTPGLQETRSAVCATRASALAMTQARMVAARVAENGTATTFITITTTGDRVQDRPVAQIGTDNVWVKELESALLDGRADYAVHSCKDLPGTLADGMSIAAITQREDPRDAFCSEMYASFYDLPPGAVVGTSSPRRRAQLRVMRPDLRFEDLRGNVDTRLRKLREGTYDAIVLAMAGLNRLGMSATHTVPFSVGRLVPAVAQGALAVETLEGNAALTRALRAACNDETTERCIAAERAALRELRAGCSAPLGIHARYEGGTLTIDGAYALEDRSLIVRERLIERIESVEAASDAGTRLARALAARLDALDPSVVLLPRTQDRPSRIAAELRLHGIEVVELREGDREPERPPDMLVFPSSGSVGVARRYLDGLRNASIRPKVAAMGERSGEAARDAGFAPDITAPEASIDAFVVSITEGLHRS